MEPSERNISRFFLALFLISLASLWFFSQEGKNPSLCLTLSFFLLLVAPGFIPALKLKRKIGLSLLEMLPLSVCLSLGQATLLLLLFDWLALPVFNSKWALLLCTLGWYIWAERSGRVGLELHSDVGSLRSDLSGRGRMLTHLALILLAIAVSVLLLNTGATLRWDADAAAHLAAIRGVMEEDRVFPVAQPYGPNGIGRPDPRFGVFPALCSLLVLSSGAEIHTLWKALPAFFAPFLILAFFSAARSITGNTKAAFIAALLFPVCYGGIGDEALRIVGYPSRVAMLVYLISLGVFFRHLRGEGKWLLSLLGVLVATAAAIHLYYFIVFVFVITCFFLLKLVVAWDNRSQILKRWAEAFGIALGVSLPLLIYRFFTSYSTANQYAIEGQGILYLDGSLYIFSPFTAYGWFGLVGVVSILLLPYFALRATQRDSHAFVAAATAGPLLLIFNPVILPLASKVLSYLAWRLMWAVPYALALGIFLTELPGTIRVQSARARFFSLVGALLVLCALVGTVSPRIDFYRDAVASKDEPFPEDLAAMSEIFGHLESEVNGRRVFLSDPVTAYAIPAFTRHFVTAIPVSHSAPTDSFPVSRVQDALDVLNPGVSLAKTLEILKRYRVEFVIVNTAFSKKLRAFEYEIDPQMQRRSLAKIASASRYFEKVFSDKELHVFRVINVKETQSPTDRVPRSIVAAESLEHEKPIASFSGLFSLEAVQIEPLSVEVGDTVRINLLWKCLSPLPREDVHKLFVRVETDFSKGPFFTRRFGKPYRKLLERKVGKRFRFREDINPDSFDHPLHLWNEGELIRQTVTLVVPEDIFPGRHRVKIRLRRITPATNFHLSDFLQDEDYYSGVEVGTLVIGRVDESEVQISREGAISELKVTGRWNSDSAWLCPKFIAAGERSRLDEVQLGWALSASDVGLGCDTSGKDSRL